MKKLILSFFLIVSLPVYSQEEKELSMLFDLSWEDGFEDVMNKLDKAKLENLEIIDSFGNKFILKDKISKSYLKDKISEIIIYDYHLLNTKPEEAIKDYRLSSSHVIQKYISKEGKETISFPTSLKIHSKDLVISNIPFDLNIKMSSNFGFAIKHPEKVFFDSLNYALPLYISSIELTSDSLNARKNKDSLDKILFEKYKDFIKLPEEKPSNEIKLLDIFSKKEVKEKTSEDIFKKAFSDVGPIIFDSKHKIQIKRLNNYYSIGYYNEFNNFISYEKELNKIYNDHVLEFKSKSVENKKDLKSVF